MRRSGFMAFLAGAALVAAPTLAAPLSTKAAAPSVHPVSALSLGSARDVRVASKSGSKNHILGLPLLAVLAAVAAAAAVVVVATDNNSDSP